MRPIRNLSLLLILLIASPAWAEGKKFTGPWDVAALQNANVKPEWGETVGKSREVYYPGEPFQGKPTRVFAYYSKPAGDGPFPAMVLVHGGGGKAFREWAEHWSARGYCALAMDLSGNGPKGRLADGGPDQSDEVKFRDFDDKTVKDMWTYHAISNVIRGHSMIRAFGEVDKTKTGVTGISWGGYLTCIVAGLDDRFQAAVPVYGCGFLHENSVWKPARFDKFEPARRDRWVNTFDPSKYLPGVSKPILFLNGTNDFAYPLDSYRKCYELVPGDKMISVRVRLPHGHIWTFPEVDQFIDSQLKGGSKLAKLGELKMSEGAASTTVESKRPIKSAMLHYAVAKGAWQQREWKSIPAMISEKGVSAKLPAETPLVFYLSVIDDQGVEVSTPHLETASK